MNVFACLCAHAHVPWHICGDQSLVFSFAVWVPGLELVVILGRSTLTF